MRHIRPYYFCQRIETDLDSFFPTFTFSCFSASSFASSFATSVLIMHHCVPPYHPCAGHESISTHDSQSGWIANDQTNGYTDSVQRSFKKWRELEHWWREKCVEQHQGHCPPFEQVTFTLNPPHSTHPSNNPCTRIPTAIVDATPSTAAASPSTASVLRVAPVVMPAPSPFGGATLSSPTSTGSSFMGSARPEPAAPRDLGYTSAAHPDGPCAWSCPRRGAGPAPAYVPAAATPVTAAPAPVAAPATTAAPVAPPTHSILMTPQAGAAPIANPAPPVAAAGAAPMELYLYGIRGVAVFYTSHESALTAAASLDLPDAKILILRNAAKMKAWILNQQFHGED
ncbi:hypothetical protein K438DRAFT_1996287 [Mycena galopus ATCC 62051]|nr:hypothetical protein K438DRAFT_1996287 [Mycena galopus ATCC 62051]